MSTTMRRAVISIELPEIKIWANQLRDTIVGRRIASVSAQFTDRMRAAGRVNNRLDDFRGLEGAQITGIRSRGFTMIVDCYASAVCHLVTAPEAGGSIVYSPSGPKPKTATKTANVVTLGFKEGSTVRIELAGRGILQFIPDEPSMKTCLIYTRDFQRGISPLEPLFTARNFISALSRRNTQIKSMLVGAHSPVVGIGNDTFQDAAFRARIHPARKVRDLSENEMRSLFESICTVIDSRIAEGGKTGFSDIHGVPGKYEAAMGSARVESGCPSCGGVVQRVRIAGHLTCLCPVCQNVRP